MNMKKCIALLVVAGLVPVSLMAGPARFRAEIKPLGVLSSSDIDDKGIRYDGGFYTYSETLDGTGSYYGTAQLGVEIDTGIGYLDILGGGGVFANGGFAGGLLVGDIGYRFKLNESGTLAIGPFFGIVVPGDSEWELDDEDESVDLKGSGGFQGGVKFTGGWEHVSFIVQVGYADFSYDMEPEGNLADWEYTENGGATWTSWNLVGDEPELDMAGLFGEFGVSIQF